MNLSTMLLNKFTKASLLGLFALASLNAQARSLMSLVDVQGIRDNELIGYGLVVGLDGTGDKNQVKFTAQSVENMLTQFGLQLDDNTNPKMKNVAAVSVTAKVGPMAGKGQYLDIVVASLGDAKSLRGGTLLLTPLKGMDGQVYAVAQGNVVLGGVGVAGADGSQLSVNTPTAGRIPNGAILEREIVTDFNSKEKITLNLKHPNFTTAKNIAASINGNFGSDVAQTISLSRIDIQAPKDPSLRVSFMSMLEGLDVQEGKDLPKVVFNSRTGTVVINQEVRIKKAAVTHAGITISIQENPQVSQPNAFSNGQTRTVNDSTINVNQGSNKMFIWQEGVDLQSIVSAVNSIGTTPDDLMQILQALDQIGAMNAELIVI